MSEILTLSKKIDDLGDEEFYFIDEERFEFRADAQKLAKLILRLDKYERRKKK